MRLRLPFSALLIRLLAATIDDAAPPLLMMLPLMLMSPAAFFRAALPLYAITRWHAATPYYAARFS